MNMGRLGAWGVLGGLLLMVLTGCDLVSSSEGEFTYWEPALSPDGAQLVYESSTESGLALFLRDLSTGTEKQLTLNEDPDWSPHWSPDGDRIVFVSKREENVDLYLLVLKTMETVRLTSHQDDDINPHWGSDGKIYFNSNRTGAWEIYTLDAETRALVQVTSRDPQP